MATEDQTETAERITHTEAYEIAKRYNRSHWRSAGERARYSIPADPRRDDDLRLYAYIKQNEARDAELARVKTQAARADAMEKACFQAVDDEPELPGEPGAEMRDLLSTVDGAINAMRAAVIVTKRNIRDRIRAAFSQLPK